MSKRAKQRANATPPLVPSRATGFSIEDYLDAAQAHGEQSGPDHEVGDLQSLVRALWNRLTPLQRAEFVDEPGWEIDAILEWSNDNG